jgi:acyl dehydratase
MSSVADTATTPDESEDGGRLQAIQEALEIALRYVDRADEIALGSIRRLEFQRYAHTIGDVNSLYFDTETARRAGYDAMLVPPLYLTSLMGATAGPTETDLRADGLSEVASFMVPVPGLRIVGAGQQVSFERPVVEGTDVFLRRRVVEAALRKGKSGPLLIFVVERLYVDEQGRTLVSCRETFIGRPTISS